MHACRRAAAKCVSGSVCLQLLPCSLTIFFGFFVGWIFFKENSGVILLMIRVIACSNLFFCSDTLGDSCLKRRSVNVS